MEFKEELTTGQAVTSSSNDVTAAGAPNASVNQPVFEPGSVAPHLGSVVEGQPQPTVNHVTSPTSEPAGPPIALDIASPSSSSQPVNQADQISLTPGNEQVQQSGGVMSGNVQVSPDERLAQPQPTEPVSTLSKSLEQNLVVTDAQPSPQHPAADPASTTPQPQQPTGVVVPEQQLPSQVSVAPANTQLPAETTLVRQEHVKETVSQQAPVAVTPDQLTQTISTTAEPQLPPAIVVPPLQTVEVQQPADVPMPTDVALQPAEQPLPTVTADTVTDQQVPVNLSAISIHEQHSTMETVQQQILPTESAPTEPIVQLQPLPAVTDDAAVLKQPCPPVVGDALTQSSGTGEEQQPTAVDTAALVQQPAAEEVPQIPPATNDVIGLPAVKAQAGDSEVGESGRPEVMQVEQQTDVSVVKRPPGHDDVVMETHDAPLNDVIDMHDVIEGSDTDDAPEVISDTLLSHDHHGATNHHDHTHPPVCLYSINQSIY